MSKPFKFKEFTVNQDQCAMKIGTDGVLLGAVTALNKNPFAILDLGAGTGIIGLMLAQRSNAEVIDALEIDDSAYEQCVSNFEQSPWGDRLFCYHASLQEFAEEIDDTYDLIVCNPPFYKDDFKSGNEQRDIARFEDAMPFEHIVVSVSKLLEKTGTFNIIIPFKEQESFIKLAEKVNLQPNFILNIKGNPTSEFKRSILEFSFNKSEIIRKELTIEIDRHVYTEDYINYTKDFYLKM